MTWRDEANDVIHKAITELGAEPRCAADIDNLFKHISKEYYPFGERSMYPYKAWLSAIQKCKEEYFGKTFPQPQEPINYNTGMFESEVTR